MVLTNESQPNGVLLLIGKKDDIENKIMEHGKILQMNKNVGMKGVLIDEFGFPRNDIDIYQVRAARNAIYCLQNDLKPIMKQIEKGIELFNEEFIKCAENPTTIEVKNEPLKEISLQPFLVVRLVSPNSPAEKADLRTNDEIIEFGSANISNCKNILEISALVNQCVNKQLCVKILRENTTYYLRLTPCAWPGRGFLGCNMSFIKY